MFSDINPQFTFSTYFTLQFVLVRAEIFLLQLSLGGGGNTFRRCTK